MIISREKLRIASVMAVLGNGFYSESISSIKSRTCIGGTRATRLTAPAPGSDAGPDTGVLLWELNSLSKACFLLPSHFISCPDLVTCLCCSKAF